MYVVSADPVSTLRSELRRSLLRPSLVRRLWYWLVFGRIPMERQIRTPWRMPGYRVGMVEARLQCRWRSELRPEGESQPTRELAPDPPADV